MPSRRVLSAALVGAAALTVQAQDRPTLDEYKDKKAEEKAAAGAVAAKDAKMAAVDKVVSMMEDLKAKVLAEGEAEAQTYNKFSCFCKDTTAEKTAAIKKAEDEVAALSTTIETLASERDELDTLISTLEADIAEAEKIMAETDATRKADLSVYEKNAADLSGAIVALESAIKALKASAKPSLVQLQSISKTIQTAVLMADALGLGSEKTQQTLAFLQQAPDVPMENYKFHSGGIIDTLEGLLKDFRQEKVDLDAEEVKSVATYDSKMQEQTDIKKAKNVELEQAQKSKSQKQEEIGTNSQVRSTTAAVLLDDQKYLMELSQMCADKAKTWDQRTKVRADELSALTAATEIIKTTVSEKTQASTIRFAQQGVAVKLAHAMAKSPEMLENLEAEAEAADSAPAFIQQSSSKARSLRGAPAKDGRQVVIELLKSKGAQLKSTLLTSLVSHVAEDPFAKVKVLIQELIERLLKEANAEANQKGWCDKATKDATQKKDYAAQEVEALNGEMATLEALRDKLTEELAVLDTEIQELKDSRADAEALRAEEKAENEHTVQEAEAGLEAVLQAIDILKKFYATVKKETVELVQQPEKDAPDAGFKNFESYNGDQSTSGGIVGMLEVIQSDFERTITETEKAEAQAEQDHLKFMTETGVSLAEKETAHEQKTAENEDAKEKLADATENFKSQAEILRGAVSELLDLKPVCVDTGMSYEERVARREDEIEALKKADCILGAYAQYGPEGLADAC